MTRLTIFLLATDDFGWKLSVNKIKHYNNDNDVLELILYLCGFLFVFNILNAVILKYNNTLYIILN